jgi:hypothetical protein
MKYIIRWNPKSLNVLTRQVNPKILWEIEQAETPVVNGRQDSEKVIWHAADVRVAGVPIRELFKMSPEGEKPWELEVCGVCTRGQDNAIEIRIEDKNASGNSH